MQISYISNTTKSKTKDITIFSFIWISILLLLIFSTNNFNLLKNTINLYLYIVFPAIFPFLFITNILIQRNLFQHMIIGKNALLCKILKVSRCSLPVLLIGSIFGYPNSINYATYLLENKYISKKEYIKLIIVCNNPSLIYILSSIGIGMLNNIKIGFILFLSITLSNLLICICYRPDINIIQQTVIMSNSFSKKKASFFEDLITAIQSSFKSLLYILGFMLLFSIIANLICNILELNNTLSSIIFGVLELTTGINMIVYNFNSTYSLYIVCFILSFSSFMVIFQLYMFCHKYIKFKTLILFKFIQTVTSCISLYILNKIFPFSNAITAFSNNENNISNTVYPNILIYIIPFVFLVLIYTKSSWHKCQLQKGDNV